MIDIKIRNRNLEVMAEAKAVIAANLPKACRELAEWRDTSMLREGVVRRVSRILAELDAANSLQLAERLIEHAAIDRVAGLDQ